MTGLPLSQRAPLNRLFRAEATKRLQQMRENDPPRQTWPEGCYGSALSWLLFVGPSPGGKHPPRLGRSSRHPSSGRCLWNQAFDQPYAEHQDAWGGKYRENIPALVETIVGLRLSRGSAKLYGFANFDWVPSPQEGSVSRTRMAKGEAVVLRVLKQARPRIIAPTTMLAHSRLLRCLRRAGYTFFIPAEQSVRIRVDPKGSAFHTEMDALKIKGKGVLSGSVVVRLPQHPARMLFCQHGHRCARAVRQALLQVYSERRRLEIEEV
jgi:hypothetical protein